MRSRNNRKLAFARVLSSAVGSQALLSAGNFVIGLVLIRSASTLDYGYYVLVMSAVLLFRSLQGAFFSPPLSIRFPKLDPVGRGELVGGLYREQIRILPLLGLIVMLITVVLWYAGILNNVSGPLMLASIVAVLATLYREYFRIVIYAHRRPQNVLHADIIYVVVSVVGVYVATLTLYPALSAVIAIFLAALVSGIMLFQTSRKIEPWHTRGAYHIIRDIAPLSMWSTAGSGIHWLFGQGYVYLVAAMLGVTAVSAIAAIRILLQPINLVSTGISTLMLPLASNWLHQHGVKQVWRRLMVFAFGMAVMTACYFSVLWLLRDWIFAVVLKKHFANRDALLMLWGAVVLVTVMRDQLVYLLAAQSKYRTLSSFTFICAGISIVTSYFAMLTFGVTGALIGMLLGESVNLLAIIIMSMRSIGSSISGTVSSTA